MMNIRILIILLFVSGLSLSAPAEEIVKLKGPAPQSLLNLSYDITNSKDSILNTGPHGLQQFCFKSVEYFVLSSNLFGEGYKISANQPDGLKCTDVNDSSVYTKNGLGMYIGMPKKEVLKLIGIDAIDDHLTVIWHSIKRMHGKDFDVQTYAQIQFVNDKLDNLSVFTTETY